jgi:hypothetical protein
MKHERSPEWFTSLLIDHIPGTMPPPRSPRPMKATLCFYRFGIPGIAKPVLYGSMDNSGYTASV